MGKRQENKRFCQIVQFSVEIVQFRFHIVQCRIHIVQLFISIVQFHIEIAQSLIVQNGTQITLDKGTICHVDRYPPHSRFY